jgi:hypothetical protein
MINAPLRSATCRIAAQCNASQRAATQLSVPTFPPPLRRDGRKPIQSRYTARRTAAHRGAAPRTATQR